MIFERQSLTVFQDEEIRPDEKTRIFINPDGPVISAVLSSFRGNREKNDVDTYGNIQNIAALLSAGRIQSDR